MKDNGLLDDIFHNFSRIIIIIPLLVLVSGVVIRLGNKSSNKPEIALSPSPSAFPSSSPILTQSPVSLQKLNLTGPLFCDFQLEGMKGSVYVKNRKVFAEIIRKTDTTNVLVEGDCYYKWEKGSYGGEKTCGISSFLNMAETLSGLGMFGIEDIVKLLPAENQKAGENVKASDIEKVISSCKDVVILDSVFKIPKGVTFKKSS